MVDVTCILPEGAQLLEKRNNCNKNNHYARCCKSQQQQNKVHAVDECDIDEFYVDVVTNNNTEEEDWIMTLKVNDTHTTMKLDTGAQANVISESEWEKNQTQTSTACNQNKSERILWSSNTIER